MVEQNTDLLKKHATARKENLPSKTNEEEGKIAQAGEIEIISQSSMIEDN